MAKSIIYSKYQVMKVSPGGWLPGGEGERAWACYILPTLFTCILPSFKVPALVPSDQGGTKVVRGSKGGEGRMGYVVLGFRVPVTSCPSNLLHLCPPTKWGEVAKVVRGSKCGRYVILCLRVPTTSASQICVLPPMYPPNIVRFHPPSLQSSHTCALPPRGGARVVRGSKGVEGSVGYVILGFRVPTTSVGAKSKVPTLFTNVLPPFKIPVLVPSDQGGLIVVKRSKGGEGSMGPNQPIHFKPPTLVASLQGEGPRK